MGRKGRHEVGVALICSQVGAPDSPLMPDLQALALTPSAGREGLESFASRPCRRVMGEKGEGCFLGITTLSGVMGAQVRPSLMLAEFMTCDIKKPRGNGRKATGRHSRADQKSIDTCGLNVSASTAQIY